MIRILFIGDVCGKPGRKVVKHFLPKLRKEYDIDLVITNIENLAHGRGATVATVNEMMAAGVDFMTAGNHIWRNREFKDLLSGKYPIIRGINYPEDLPGRGWGEISIEGKGTILVISVMGIGFMNERLVTEPYRKLDSFLKTVDYHKYSGIFVDFHAETTSEKLGAGLFLDGRISALVGTHTHVPTADERILPGGTAYITDVGMAGPMNSVLWVKKDIIFEKNMFPYSRPFDIEEHGPYRFDAVLVDVIGPRASKRIVRINSIL